MSDAFDPYYIWLGIPTHDQPPNHYRLLGVMLFETSREVIEAAANRQMAYMQEISSGEEHIDEAQEILGELSRARICLLNSEKKAAYDAKLRASFDAIAPAPESTAEQTPAASATPTADDSLIPPQFGLPDDEAEDDEAGPSTPAPAVGLSQKMRTPSAAKGKKQSSLMPIIAAAVVTLLLIGGGLLFYLSGEAKKQEEQQLAQVAEKKRAEKAEEEAAQRQAKQPQQNAAAERGEKRKAAREAAEQKAQEEANRKAEAEAKEEAKQKAAEEAERKAEEGAKQKAKEAAKKLLAKKNLERRESASGVIGWYLNTEEAAVYDRLKEDQTPENVEKIGLAHARLIQQYQALHEELEKEDSELQRDIHLLGGQLASIDAFPLWPDQYHKELAAAGLKPKEEDDETVYFFTDNETLYKALTKLKAIKEEFIKAKRKGGKGVEEKVAELETQLAEAQELYVQLNQKYQQLESNKELLAKIASLGGKLSPRIKSTAWEFKIGPYKRIVKKNLTEAGQPQSAGRVPRPFYDPLNKKLPLTFNGKRGGQDAIPGQIGQPPVITAEVIVCVNQGKRYGAIVGQLYYKEGDERGWQLGYNQLGNFQFMIGPEGGRAVGHRATSSTRATKNDPPTLHHVIGTYDGQTARIYVDGKPEGKGKPYGKKSPINYPRKDFLIGAFKDADEYIELDGTIYSIRLYTDVFKDAQVKARYDQVKKNIDELNNSL